MWFPDSNWPDIWNMLQYQPNWGFTCFTWGRFWYQSTRQIRLWFSEHQRRTAFEGSQSFRQQPSCGWLLGLIIAIGHTNLRNRIIFMVLKKHHHQHHQDHHQHHHGHSHLVLRVGHLDGTSVHQLWGQVLHLARLNFQSFFLSTFRNQKYFRWTNSNGVQFRAKASCLALRKK